LSWSIKNIKFGFLVVENCNTIYYILSMSVLEIIKKRRSVRRFKSDPIPEEAIDKLIEAIIWAPSAGNLQSRKFYFVFREDLKEKLAKAALNQNFIAQAPLIIVACGDERIVENYGQRGKEIYMICEVAASIQNLMLVATEQGLGTCWIGAFNEEDVKEILNLPENLKPIAIIPVGWPAGEPAPPKRVSKTQAVEFIK
jgi:nitroreductase